MKKLKKPTAAQRKLMKANKMNVEHWLVERDTSEELVLVHRFGANIRIIYK